MSEESMWCRHHNTPVDWSTFQWKGCWGCGHFSGLNSDEYVYVEEAAELLGVTEQTIRRWIRTNILKGTRYKRLRSQFTLASPPARYVVDRKSIERVRNKRGSSNSDSSVKQ